jgi:hypothetical protein
MNSGKPHQQLAEDEVDPSKGRIDQNSHFKTSEKKKQ